jgi:NAD(P)-dependent dehydrogenase (short-subunit alcohol dehydrogenase family)
MQSPLKKIALVTGANKGIGFEVARQLAAAGCSVLLGARNRALGEEVAATLKREGCDVRYLSIDLDDPATIANAAKDMQATPMQVALAWLLQRSPNILLIPGTSSVGHLRENLAAATLQLPAEVLAELDRIGGDSKP